MHIVDPSLSCIKCINWQTTNLPTEGIHWTAEVAFNHIDYCSCIPSGISKWCCLLTALFSHFPFTFWTRVPTIYTSLVQLENTVIDTSIPRRPFNSDCHKPCGKEVCFLTPCTCGVNFCSFLLKVFFFVLRRSCKK